MSSQFKASSILYIVRHGECLGNILKQNICPEQSALTDNGKLQAKLLGEFLHNVKFTLAFTSDYLRAVQTAEIMLSLNAFSQDILLEKTENLREKNLGTFEGANYSDIFTAIEKSGSPPLDWIPDGGENLADVEQRIQSFLETIFAAVDNSSGEETILTVSHSLFIVHLFKYLSEKPKNHVLKNWNPNCCKACSNTGYFKLSIQKNPSQNDSRQIEILVAHGNEHLQTLNNKNTFQTLTNKHERYKSYKGCVHQ